MNKVRISDVAGMAVYLFMVVVILYLVTQGLGLPIDLGA